MAEFPESQLLVYADEAGRIKIDVRLEDGSVWLTQQAIAELFQTTVQNINLRISISPHLPAVPPHPLSASERKGIAC